MPELAEVEYYRRCWQPARGRRIVAVEGNPGARVFRDTSLAAVRGLVEGHALRASRRHGKQLYFRFGADRWIRIRLGMTGALDRLGGADVADFRHAHLRLRHAGGWLVFRDPRMFGSVQPSGRGVDPHAWASLPPTPEDEGFTVRHLERQLERRAGSPLKAVLLDQAIFPGIGNWMADEILWRMHVHPATPCGEVLDRVGDLRRRTRFVARGALRVIAPDWGDLPETWLMNHRWRDGGVCPRCRGALTRGPVAGRTTCWCPLCQGEG